MLCQLSYAIRSVRVYDISELSLVPSNLPYKLILWSNSQCAVKYSDHRTTFFPYKKGVRQGCTHSPLLFNFYILNELYQKFSNRQVQTHRYYLMEQQWAVLFTQMILLFCLIIWRAKLLKYDWLMRRAFFLNSGQKLLDPDWLRCFIFSIRTKYQKYTK